MADKVDTTAENPYWLDALPEPHPNPALGCIRRGLCCRSNPGRFGPGEVEKAAQLLDITPDAFVKKYIVIDTIDAGGTPVDVFAPVKLDRFGQPAIAPASRTDTLYNALRGTCVFFSGTGCRIYKARPIECKKYICTNEPEDNLSMTTLGQMWQQGEEGTD